MLGKQGEMNFTISHKRAFTGNDIYVKVEADPGKPLAVVRTVLDDFELGNDSLADGSESYERAFSGAGDAGSGIEHSLEVTAQQADGASHSSTSMWTDPV